MLYSGYTLLDCNDNVPENACIFEAVTSTLRTNSSVYISQAKFIWAFDRLVRIELGWLESATKNVYFKITLYLYSIHAENQVRHWLESATKDVYLNDYLKTAIYLH